MAMIREYGSPTLFMTFSCAEYDSPEIVRYLHKANEVPPKYPIPKVKFALRIRFLYHENLAKSFMTSFRPLL